MTRPEQPSGGQKQRVAIAGAIARNPKILILDEAGAMLDPRGKKEIRKSSRTQREKPDLTIINITHEIDEAYDADRVLVLNSGSIILDGKPEVVFANDTLLKQIHLDIPFAHKLANSLREKGLDVGPINNEKELEEILCR